MLDLVKRFFGRETANSGGLRDGAGEQDILVAACALLLEMAHVDGEFDQAERKRLISILEKDYGLSRDDVHELIASAQDEREGSIDLWRFAGLINEHYTIGEKIRVIETVWKVAFTDGHLDKHEDYLVHKLARLLRLDHKQLMEAKLKVMGGKDHPPPSAER